MLWKKAGITTLSELVDACEDNRLATLPGFGPKKQARALANGRSLLRASAGILLASALETASVLEAALRAGGASDVAVSGDARRGTELVRELVMVARGIDASLAAAVLDGVASLGGGRASTKGSDVRIVVHGALPVRVRIAKDEDWLYTLVTSTGDGGYVRWLESRAKGRLAEACAQASSEEALYAAIGVRYAPPELRVGASPRVPAELVAREEVRGVFHVHTDWSDGTQSILEMARAASAAGFSYVGISDHSHAASYANGLDAARLEEQRAAIAIARREVPGCAIFHGVEVDILEDGALDLADETLAALDFVIASVHSRMGMSEAEMTARIVRAVSHPLVTILGHPTGRLLLGRKGYTFDVAAVARAAAANDTYLEINANAQSLDLDADLVRRAAAEGARFAIDPDAHAARGLHDTRLGVTMARRAGLASHQLLNARDRAAIEHVLTERKSAAIARMQR
jgi:DNA polymerase (family 10)